MSIKIKKIRVGIVGASGYTGSELIRLLLNHPNVNISFALSKTNNHKKITDLYNDLIDETDLSFVDKFNNDVDVIFLCSGHNKSIEFINNNQIKNTTKIIDLSQDFRNNNFHEKSNRKFVYGLPEINKKIISRSKNIANPGCFATAILLGIIPSVKYNLPEDDIHINAITGSTGAGIIPKESTHFSWRNNNITWYKPFEHQHLEEINNILKGVNEKEHNLNLITYRGPFSRGIYCTSYFKSSKTIEQITECYKKFYLSASFVKISKNEIDLKNVVNSNKCLINLKKINDKILVTSVIDNLIKGASGQAIQNMNIMFGIEDLVGINLKSIIY
jgi:N-acetyl-gamma-glutamyl-phosphate reductase